MENERFNAKPANGIVQPPVTPPSDKKGRVTNQSQFMYDVVLKALMGHRCAWPFEHPVDAIKLDIPDYHDIVEFPMDLTTIKQRLENQWYNSAKECQEDFNLIFYNCHLYNQPDQDVTKMATALENVYKRKIRSLPEPETEIMMKDIKPGNPENIKRKRGRPKGSGRIGQGFGESSTKKLPKLSSASSEQLNVATHDDVKHTINLGRSVKPQQKRKHQKQVSHEKTKKVRGEENKGNVHQQEDIDPLTNDIPTTAYVDKLAVTRSAVINTEIQEEANRLKKLNIRTEAQQELQSHEKFSRKYMEERNVLTAVTRECEEDKGLELPRTTQKQKEELNHVGISKWHPQGLTYVPTSSDMDTCSQMLQKLPLLSAFALALRTETQRPAEQLEKRKPVEDKEGRPFSLSEEDEFEKFMFTDFPEAEQREFLDWRVKR